MVAVHGDLDRRLIGALHLARLAGPLPLDLGVATDFIADESGPADAAGKEKAEECR